MVSLDVTFLYLNIPIIDTLNIIKDNINNDNQFTRKTDTPQDKFLDLVHLVLTAIWYTFNSQFYQQTDGLAIGGSASSITAEIYMQVYERRLMSVRIWKTLSMISTIFIKILSLLWRKKVMEN